MAEPTDQTIICNTVLQVGDQLQELGAEMTPKMDRIEFRVDNLAKKCHSIHIRMEGLRVQYLKTNDRLGKIEGLLTQILANMQATKE